MEKEYKQIRYKTEQFFLEEIPFWKGGGLGLFTVNTPKRLSLHN